jgi:hypothetical protein
MEIDSRKLSAQEIEVIDSLITRYKFVMCLVTRGKVFLLLRHWRYLVPETGAPRVALFKSNKLKDGIYYNTSI